MRIVALALCAAIGSRAAFGLDISSLLEVPYPSGLVAAAYGEKIAWIANERGVRNISTASPPRFEPQLLTHWTEDDGQDIGSLRLSRDGSTAVWVRGGHPDAAGFSQNPQSIAGGVVQEVWIATSSTPPRKLGDGDGPVLSPDGREVLITQGQTLSCLPTTRAAAPDWCTAPLLKLRGNNARPAFSPDGRHIAFVSDRKDHSFIGVFDTASRKVTWLAPDANRDDFPAWSPDGKHVAFIRVAGARFGELFNFMGAWPFEIWIADAASGAGRRVFRSNDLAGGFAQFDSEGPTREPLRWSAADQLLFYSEASGWMHVFALSPAGGEPRDLTPGNCEVESDSLAVDGRSLIVSSNCAEIDGRQLFRVSIAGGTPERLPGGTIDVAPVFVGATQQYAYLTADAVQPTSVAVVSTGKPQLIYPTLPRSFPAHLLIKPKIVTFQAADGLTIHGQLFQLPGLAAAKRPAVVFVHGGPVRQILPGWHYMDYYSYSYAMNQCLTSRGFVVLSVNYRGGIGYGQSFRLAKAVGPRGASEYQDVLAARGYLARLPEVDPARIGIWGGSYGGLLTAQALARNSDLFAAGVDFHGIHDWVQMAKDGDGASWAIDPSLYGVAYNSSPVAAASSWKSPVLFIHGDDDRSVPFSQTTDLTERLREQRVHVETLVLPDEEHGFLRYANWLRAYANTADFLTRMLQHR